MAGPGGDLSVDYGKGMMGRNPPKMRSWELIHRGRALCDLAGPSGPKYWTMAMGGVRSEFRGEGGDFPRLADPEPIMWVSCAM